jgi:hypothetical protein
MKPLMKLCEETNGLMKEMLKQMAEQTHLIKELVNVPRELQKSTEQLSHVVHMVCRSYDLPQSFSICLIISASQSITNTTTK